MKRALTLTSAAALVAATLIVPSPATATPTAPAAAPLRDGLALPATTAVVQAQDPDEKVTLKATSTWVDGARYARYQRTWKGLPVIGGDYTVPLTQSRASSAAPGRPGVALHRRSAALRSTTPRLAQASAASKGRALGTRDLGRGAVAGASSTRTVVHLGQDGTPRLAYDVTTEATTGGVLTSRKHVYLDAQDGAVLSVANDVSDGTGRGSGVYDANVTFSTTWTSKGYSFGDGYGNVARNMNHKNVKSSTYRYHPGEPFYDADNVWDGTGQTYYSGHRQGVDAQFALERTFGYFRNVLGRAGWKNDGRGIPARTHAGANGVACWENANYDGSFINLGDGAGCTRPFTELDIVAHEITHGMTWNTAGLVYELESGALNESMSDIFGTMVEFQATLASDPPDYFIGEKMNFYGDGKPLRYMDTPSKDGYSMNCWSPRIAQRNASGNEMVDVHYSSGVMNHAFYLLAEGSGTKTINGARHSGISCGGAPAVWGIGRDAAARITWGALTSPYLPSTASFTAFRDEMIRAAATLYGWGSSQCYGVEAAMTGSAVKPGKLSCRSPLTSKDYSVEGRDDLLATTASPSSTASFAYEHILPGATTRGPLPVVWTNRAPWPAKARQVRYAGNFNLVGMADVLVVDASGVMWLYPRTYRSWGSPVRLGAGWEIFREVLAPGDIDGNGRMDVLVIEGDRIKRYLRGPYGWSSVNYIGSGYSGVRTMLAPGDWNGDRRPDLLTFDAAGVMWLRPGTSSATFGAPLRVNGGWGMFRQVAAPGDVTGDGKMDLVGALPDGTLRIYAGNGKGGFLRVTTAAAKLPAGANMLR